MSEIITSRQLAVECGLLREALTGEPANGIAPATPAWIAGQWMRSGAVAALDHAIKELQHDLSPRAVRALKDLLRDWDCSGLEEEMEAAYASS